MQVSLRCAGLDSAAYLQGQAAGPYSKSIIDYLGNLHTGCENDDTVYVPASSE